MRGNAWIEDSLTKDLVQTIEVVVTLEHKNNKEHGFTMSSIYLIRNGKHVGYEPNKQQVIDNGIGADCKQAEPDWDIILEQMEEKDEHTVNEKTQICCV